MNIILNYLWRLWMLILALIITSLVFIPIFILSFKKESYKFAYIFVRIWSYTLFYGMGFRYQFHNLSKKEVQKHKAYVIIANHTSPMDIMLCAILFPHHPICFVGKKELVKIPIFGSIYKRICVMVDRSSTKSRADVYRRCAERMELGNSVVIFPEGGVPDDTSIILDNFKDGAFILANRHQFPIVVLTFYGLKEMFPFTYSKGHPGKVHVFLNDILDPDLSSNELKNISYHEIKKTLENPNVAKN